MVPSVCIPLHMFLSYVSHMYVKPAGFVDLCLYGVPKAAFSSAGVMELLEAAGLVDRDRQSAHKAVDSLDRGRESARSSWPC